MFADKYLNKNNNQALIKTVADKGTAIIVVIPCLREPDVLQTLQSLQRCNKPRVKVEVLVIINHSEMSSQDVKLYNTQTKSEIENWICKNQDETIRYYAIGPLELKKKWAGAGLARKSGMDEAIRRFNTLEYPEGIIVSLDADTLVDKNYLVEIELHFRNNPKQIGATICFEHQKHNLPPKQLEGIQLYEKYLAYYKQALDYAGYPYSMFTIGSAFAVKALAYVKRGGMNRRQAGEDFYFLQNLVQIGEIGEITTTKVYPSARLSNRVPFGTGPMLQKWMTGEEDLKLTYNFQAFKDLKEFFEQRENLFRIDSPSFENVLAELPDSVKSFLLHDGFKKELDDLNKNCSNLVSFNSRYFQKFNAFKVLKYLNYVHEHYCQKADIMQQIARLNQEKQA